jgi:hypothetical protein
MRKALIQIASIPLRLRIRHGEAPRIAAAAVPGRLPASGPWHRQSASSGSLNVTVVTVEKAVEAGPPFYFWYLNKDTVTVTVGHGLRYH